MQKPLVLNLILSKLFNNKEREYLKTKISRIKPIVDSKCPESFYYLQNKFSKTQKNNWNGTKINMTPKINYNPKNKNRNNKTKFRPLFKYEHDFLTYTRKQELIDVAMQNLNIYNRLNSKKGTYPLNNHLKDYQKAQYYKKNYCKFPSIDFYRTSKNKNENLCSIFNYCTFYNYKTINDKFVSDYMKKTNKIMHKTKSASEMINADKYLEKRTFNFSPFKKKNKDQKIMYQNKTNYVNIRNHLFQNKEIKSEDEKKENIPENDNNKNIIIIGEEGYKDNDEENHNNKNKKDNKVINNNEEQKSMNKSEIIEDEEKNKDIEKKSNNSLNKSLENNNKEDKIEKVEVGENVKNDDINIDSCIIKEGEEIEESIDYEKVKK